MRPFVLGGLAVALFGVLSVAYLCEGIKIGVVADSCQIDDEIAPAQRTTIDDAAMAAVTAALGSRPEAMFPMMTTAAQDTTSPQKLGAQLKAFQGLGPYSNLRVAHTYLIEAAGGGMDTTVICGLVNGSDWVALRARPGLTQAHVVVSAQTHNNEWAVTIWLQLVGSEWRVANYSLGVSGVVGHSADEMLVLARREREIGHVFNAYMLYVELHALVDRGPTFQLGIEQAVQEDIQNLKIPPELQGQPPFSFQMKGEDYKVSQVSILGVDGKLGLSFNLPEDKWGGDADADKRNRAFLSAFIATHPEYWPPFAFLVGRTVKPDGSGSFSTVYEVDKGFR